jgi:hypothetical protein
MEELDNIKSAIEYIENHIPANIGDCMIEALEKQTPKKPVWNCNNEVIHCPNCDYDLMGGIEIDYESDPEYCWKCGQKLDWEVNKKEGEK